MKLAVVDVDLGARESGVRQREDKWVECPQVEGRHPVQLRPGVDDGEVSVFVALPNGVATRFDVRIDDLRVALDLVEVQD